MRFKLLLVVLGFSLGGSALGANLVLNPGFDDAPILGPGQTDVSAGEMKMIIVDPANPDYAGAITGVPHWLNGLESVWSDQGISRDVRLTPIDGERMGFINNWNRRFSQELAHTVAAGDRFRVRAWVGSIEGAARCGRVSLVAGGLDPTNYDQFASDAILLAERTAGTSQWSDFTPDVLLPGVGWQQVQFEYQVASNDPAIGKPLLVSLRTEAGSVGHVHFDAISVEVVPEPATLTALLLGLVCLRRRRH